MNLATAAAVRAEMDEIYAAMTHEAAERRARPTMTTIAGCDMRRPRCGDARPRWRRAAEPRGPAATTILGPRPRPLSGPPDWYLPGPFPGTPPRCLSYGPVATYDGGWPSGIPRVPWCAAVCGGLAAPLLPQGPRFEPPPLPRARASSRASELGERGALGEALRRVRVLERVEDRALRAGGVQLDARVDTPRLDRRERRARVDERLAWGRCARERARARAGERESEGGRASSVVRGARAQAEGGRQRGAGGGGGGSRTERVGAELDAEPVGALGEALEGRRGRVHAVVARVGLGREPELLHRARIMPRIASAAPPSGRSARAPRRGSSPTAARPRPTARCSSRCSGPAR